MQKAVQRGMFAFVFDCAKRASLRGISSD